MSKRFVISGSGFRESNAPQQKVTVTVDDRDAHILRNEVFRALARKQSGHIEIYTYRGGVQVSLGARIVNPADGFAVEHINGDCLDFRRENLRAVARNAQRRNAILAGRNKNHAPRELDHAR